MKNIINKSILLKKSRDDGLRICVMRRIRPEYEFDVWMPVLAPSEKLLKAYVINKKIGWREFSVAYKKETLNKQKDILRHLVDWSKTKRITLLCGESSARFCHRSLIVEACEDIKKTYRTA